uniref:Uncharacterized protein n=1 Tax=Setaria viridis TaxID=4556 RepID=A0A4V6D3U9_SETVI|nr:hypothetical protein SEVIR_7G078533v2 [Setaria viridis]
MSIWRFACVVGKWDPRSEGHWRLCSLGSQLAWGKT